MKALIALLVLSVPAFAQETKCPFPDQKPMLLTRVYFGQTIPNSGRISTVEWRSFLTKMVEPRFPGGFTIYDAVGRWNGVPEPTKIIEVAAEDTAAFRTSIGEIAQYYRQHFRQEAIGVVTMPGCGAFS